MLSIYYNFSAKSLLSQEKFKINRAGALIDCHHQLADNFARCHGGDRLTPALERISGADPGMDLALVPKAEQFGYMGGIGLGIARRESSPEDSANVAAF